MPFFIPVLTYNIDEHSGDNHYNCPVVAYYSELLSANTEVFRRYQISVSLFKYQQCKRVGQRGCIAYLKNFFSGISKGEVEKAVMAGLDAYDAWMADIRREGRRALSFARSQGYPIMILAGRPYHADAEVGHGIDRLATSLGFVVVSEDSISDLSETPDVEVLNQWTYHARLYRAANYACHHDDCQLVQLVSFGCGVDAITTDEIRSMLERSGKLYTQLKIDEITNLGAVKIRLAQSDRRDGRSEEFWKQRER